MTTNINKTFLLIALVVTGVIGGVALLQASSNVPATQAEVTAQEVATTNEQAATVSAKSSSQKAATASKDDEDDEDERPVGQPTLMEAQAISIAKNAYTGNGRMTEVQLEMENGVLVYGVEFTESDGNEVDVKVNAKTGAIVAIESDETDGDDEDDGEDD